MGTTRLRKPQLKDGELRIYWGRDHRDDYPDLMLAWQGDSGMKRDTNLLYSIICSKRPTISATKVDWYNMQRSLIEELEERGYDITTFKFSIMKKKSCPKALNVD